VKLSESRVKQLMAQPNPNRARIDAESIWRTGIEAVDAGKLVEKNVSVDRNLVSGSIRFGDVRVELNSFDDIIVVGAGKASHCMAEGLEAALGETIAVGKKLRGQINIPDDQEFDLQFIQAIGCREPGVNLPTPRVLAETEKVLNLVESCDERTLCIYLNSGGGSALLEKSSLDLEMIVAATNWLSSHGASIDMLNTVRAALSDVKGGGLARALKRGRMVSLTIADVMSGAIEHVSSGPTFAREGDRARLALDVLRELKALDDPNFPRGVLTFLETAKLDSSMPTNIENVLIGDNSVAVAAAIRKATELGYEIGDPSLLDSSEDGPALGRAAAQIMADSSDSQICFVSGGEPTMQLCASPGRGGRNQHAVLVALRDLLMLEKVANLSFCFLSAGSDGEDGNVPVAGAAISDADLRVGTFSLSEIEKAIERCDSHTILSNHVVHGPMRTNVCDLRVLVIMKHDQ
jgi:glycerate-2-kinase